jgi:Baseplate J-like protein
VAPGLQMAVAPLLDDQPRPPGGLLWLRLRRQRAVEGVCDLVDLHPNAVLAERVDAARTGDDLGRALPPGQITGPLEPVPGLAALAQPYSSFAGRPAEQGALFNTRVAERLRHRQRALTPWDYEHLVLAQFPQLYKVKCLRADARWQPEPGAVDLIVVPDITQRQPFDPFAPRASAELIADISAYLADKLPASARLRVRNAHFIPVKVRCGVRFMPGTDEGWCRQQLNDDLNRFLSPWAYAEGADLVIGGSLYANSILHYIETRPYVDYIAGLRLFTGDQGRFTLVPDQPVHAITPQRADAVLVAADRHEFDVIAANDQRVQGFEGIGSMRIELDFSIA